MFWILLCGWDAGRIITGILFAALRNSSLWSRCQSAVCTSHDSRGRTEADWKDGAGTACACARACQQSVGVFESVLAWRTKTTCGFERRALEECCSPGKMSALRSDDPGELSNFPRHVSALLVRWLRHQGLIQGGAVSKKRTKLMWRSSVTRELMCRARITSVQRAAWRLPSA